MCSCQEVLLDNMKIGMNIAKNAALRENIFMMAVCIELRIPLFLVGKPGSSKSLAKSIIADSMCGKRSQNALLKDFKEVIIIFGFSFSIVDAFKILHSFWLILSTICKQFLNLVYGTVYTIKESIDEICPIKLLFHHLG